MRQTLAVLCVVFALAASGAAAADPGLVPERLELAGSTTGHPIRAPQPRHYGWDPWPVSTGIVAPSPEPAPVQPATPSSAPAAAPVPGGYLTAAQVAGYAEAAGFPADAINTMVGFAARESGYCPTAVNGYGCAGTGHAYDGGPACGLWQLYPCPGPDALGPMANAWLAREKCLSAIAAGGSCFDPWS
jgi:hypothetical protein